MRWCQSRSFQTECAPRTPSEALSERKKQKFSKPLRSAKELQREGVVSPCVVQVKIELTLRHRGFAAMSFEDNDDDDDELQLDEDDEVSPSFPTQKSAVQPLPTPFPVNGGVVRNWPDRSWGTQSQKSPTSNQLGAALAETLQPNRAAKSAPQVRLIDDLSESSNKCAYANQPGRTRSLVQKQGLPSASHSVASSARTSSSRAEPQVTVRRPAASMPRTANVGERIPVESSHTRAPFAREGASTSRKRPRRRRIPGPAGEIDGSQAAPAADEGRSAFAYPCVVKSFWNKPAYIFQISIC